MLDKRIVVGLRTFYAVDGDARQLFNELADFMGAPKLMTIREFMRMAGSARASDIVRIVARLGEIGCGEFTEESPLEESTFQWRIRPDVAGKVASGQMKDIGDDSDDFESGESGEDGVVDEEDSDEDEIEDDEEYDEDEDEDDDDEDDEDEDDDAARKGQRTLEHRFDLRYGSTVKFSLPEDLADEELEMVFRMFQMFSQQAASRLRASSSLQRGRNLKQRIEIRPRVFVHFVFPENLDSDDAMVVEQAIRLLLTRRN
jgi:hypothetical protein